MFCITQLKIVISILIFTFYIINQIYIYIYSTHNSESFLDISNKIELNGVSEQPRGGIPALNVMAIRDQRHANVSKQRTLLVDLDVALPHGAA